LLAIIYDSTCTLRHCALLHAAARFSLCVSTYRLFCAATAAGTAACDIFADQLATLPDVQLLLAPEALHEQAEQLQQQLNSSRAPDSELQLQLVPVITMAAAAEPRQRTSEQQQEQEQQQQQQLLFDFVAVGGTFDRLHAGHRLLLAATALVCKKQVYVGITGRPAEITSNTAPSKPSF
jgi:lipid II:glycine glycyltransferase (peptidoglycan interpeptide bridge formation enzyme)